MTTLRRQILRPQREALPADPASKLVSNESASSSPETGFRSNAGSLG